MSEGNLVRWHYLSLYHISGLRSMCILNSSHTCPRYLYSSIVPPRANVTSHETMKTSTLSLILLTGGLINAAAISQPAELSDDIYYVGGFPCTHRSKQPICQRPTHPNNGEARSVAPPPPPPYHVLQYPPSIREELEKFLEKWAKEQNNRPPPPNFPPPQPNKGSSDDKRFWDRLVKMMVEVVEFAGKKANPFGKEKSGKPGKPGKPGKQA